ncbi:MAG: 3-hydroxyacyl-CoA dehydrogenase family protein [Deltaproteobacteria bacterium]|nr:3-hydroxyacyl-CoA dehydrogenase family protein [Deltaproteobacteria bacterium]MBM4323902.1 3-hydroxyacyl-CoA dehydrogenase family protein [Deltaproteobacteria bacterium]MBM4347319.1 3-hydroxyacyl-CoA dehydrogenase family protein [Deltaproteobacteria bacterium]
MNTQCIFIQGAGTMGSGIAQVSAQAGFEVILMDLAAELVQKGMNSIDKSLQRGVEKGKMKAEEKAAILSRIKPVTDLKEAKKADLVIEAVFEDLEVKKKVFKALDEVCPPHAVLASNTSALPIAAMASTTKRPDKVLGLHFMNPVPVMRGVEIIRAITTSEETMAIGRDYLKRLGKEIVEAVDYAGFIVSRVLDAMLNEAVRCVMDGNRPEEVDKAMKICTNFPMGPLELIDLAGVDIVFHGLETMEKDFGDRFHPAHLLRQMVRAGHLGRKTGKGFYNYT